MPRKKVLLIHTGGTLGMKMPGHTRAELAPSKELDRLTSRVPELEEIADIELISPWNIDSSQISPEDWQDLAKLISEKGCLGQKDDRGNPKTYSGIVIIHGTVCSCVAQAAWLDDVLSPRRCKDACTCQAQSQVQRRSLTLCTRPG